MGRDAVSDATRLGAADEGARPADGAQQLFNAGDEPARYLIAATHTSPEVVEYPDSGMVLLSGRGKTRKGPRFDVSRRSAYPATAMLLANVMDRFRGAASCGLAGPRGAL